MHYISESFYNIYCFHSFCFLRIYISSDLYICRRILNFLPVFKYKVTVLIIFSHYFYIVLCCWVSLQDKQYFKPLSPLCRSLREADDAEKVNWEMEVLFKHSNDRKYPRTNTNKHGKHIRTWIFSHVNILILKLRFFKKQSDISYMLFSLRVFPVPCADKLPASFLFHWKNEIPLYW